MWGTGTGWCGVSVNTALRIVRTRWRIVTLCLLLGLLGAGAATYLTPKEYSSDVTLYVSLQGRADSSDAAYQAGQLAKDRVVSYAPLLQDERITQPVIDKLRLGITAGQLADRIQVTVQPDTVVLSAAVTDVSPQRAADIANALASEFVGLVGDLEQPIGPAPPPPAPGQSAAQPTKIGVQIIRPASAVLVPISPRPAFNWRSVRRWGCSSGSPRRSCATRATRGSAPASGSARSRGHPSSPRSRTSETPACIR